MYRSVPRKIVPNYSQVYTFVHVGQNKFYVFFNDVFIEVLYAQSIALSTSFAMIYLNICLNKNLNLFFDFFILGLSEAKGPKYHNFV
jgi:hypothetical protein